MSDRNKAVARHYIEEVWNKCNHSAIDETHHAESYVHHDPGDPWRVEHAPGSDAVKNMVHFYQDSFSDTHITLDEMVAEGDAVVARFHSRSIHTKEFSGIKPANAAIETTGVFWWRFADGKIVESWVYWDAYGFLRQLGAIPDVTELLP